MASILLREPSSRAACETCQQTDIALLHDEKGSRWVCAGCMTPLPGMEVKLSRPEGADEAAHEANRELTAALGMPEGAGTEEVEPSQEGFDAGIGMFCCMLEGCSACQGTHMVFFVKLAKSVKVKGETFTYAGLCPFRRIAVYTRFLE